MIVSNSNIENLPAEILFIIISTLDTGEVYYSFVDINNRFNQLILDPIYICNLNMTMKSFYDRTFSIDDPVLSKISYFEFIIKYIDWLSNKIQSIVFLFEIILNFTLYHWSIWKRRNYFNIWKVWILFVFNYSNKFYLYR